MTREKIMKMSLEELQNELEHEGWEFAIYREADEYIGRLLELGVIQWQEILNGEADSEHFFACWDEEDHNLKTVKTEEDARFEMMESLMDCYGIRESYENYLERRGL